MHGHIFCLLLLLLTLLLRFYYYRCHPHTHTHRGREQPHSRRHTDTHTHRLALSKHVAAFVQLNVRLRHLRRLRHRLLYHFSLTPVSTPLSLSLSFCVRACMCESVPVCVCVTFALLLCLFFVISNVTASVILGIFSFARFLPLPSRSPFRPIWPRSQLAACSCCFCAFVFVSLALIKHIHGVDWTQQQWQQ